MIAGIKLDSLGKMLDRFGVVAGSKRLVAQCLEIVSLAAYTHIVSL